MDSSQAKRAFSPHPNPHLPSSSSLPLRTASSTPMSSPGLFSPCPSRNPQPTSVSESNTPAPTLGSSYLHPLKSHRVRETHKALIDSDIVTGRKSINQYEVIEEIGRGMHGKVKLARNTQTGENVAIKIIPRFSKKRRLGRVTAMSPQDKTKKEIAILKKIRHPNVVALLEVIDDPELKKIYMVLEHVELGEVVWRKKGLPHTCLYERRRVEREMRGEAPTAEEELYDQILERRQALKELKRVKLAQNHTGPSQYWSVEHGAADDGGGTGTWSRIPSGEDIAVFDGQTSPAVSRSASRAPSRTLSTISAAPEPTGSDGNANNSNKADWDADLETPIPTSGSCSTLNTGTLSIHHDGPRVRSSSMAESIISHMSSVDYNPRAHDPFAEDCSFVPCFTIDQARLTFRDTVLGLEYLHYQGVVHRDIKPANLLWTRDHRVKISDFGVSYFGRPIRDGELDETVSESEAKDFDNDLELAKTVGTPAFFAPELCYTDVDSKKQPKVSEQIDVWSLGVTLYCLIYARIPFLAEDEFQMFRKIATEEIHISRRRLKPVDPSTSPSTTSLYKRQNAHPYRDDNDLEYEEVDNLLYDLLRQMLVKNPDKRIRLRDIKRHPWVVQGINNPVGWLDDTDPARPTCGRRIQVDEKDMSFAVVPLKFLERARSFVKKAVGKVINPLVDRGESRSRRRATSSAASSAGDSVFKHTGPPTQYTGDRRGSIRTDDYFYNVNRDGPTDEPIIPSSIKAKEDTFDYDPLATILSPWENHGESVLTEVHHADQDDRCVSTFQNHSWHGHSRLVANFSHTSPPHAHADARLISPALRCAGEHDDPHNSDQSSARMRDFGNQGENSLGSTSADRTLFANIDKRAHAQVALCDTLVSGSIQAPRYVRPVTSTEFRRGQHNFTSATPSLSSSSKVAAATYQHGQPQSDPNFHTRQQTFVDERPRTAHRIENNYAPMEAIVIDAASTPLTSISPDGDRVDTEIDAASIPCPSSPRPPECSELAEALSRGGTLKTIKSSSVESMEAIGTPLTSPSETLSPVVRELTSTKSSSRSPLVFQSDASLPALLSGASSVSADIEGELLGLPGIVRGPSPRLKADDLMTSSVPAKDSTSSIGMDHVFAKLPVMDSGPLAPHLDSVGTGGPHEKIEPERRQARDADGEGSDDDILLMTRSHKRVPQVYGGNSRPVEAKRRDTGASTTITETAKKVPVQDAQDDIGANACAISQPLTLSQASFPTSTPN